MEKKWQSGNRTQIRRKWKTKANGREIFKGGGGFIVAVRRLQRTPSDREQWLINWELIFQMETRVPERRRDFLIKSSLINGQKLLGLWED